MTPDVLLMTPTRPDALARLEAGYALHRLDHAPDRDALLDRHGAQIRAIAAIGHVPIDVALLDRLPALEIISCGSAG